MDFEDTKEESAFREQARTWLQANAPTEAEMSGMDTMARAKFWQKRKAEGGWACIRWPKAFGGRDASELLGPRNQFLASLFRVLPLLFDQFHRPLHGDLNNSLGRAFHPTIFYQP